MPWCRAATGGLLLFLAIASCSMEQADPSDCSGAAGLDGEHADILACAGWLDYVKERVCTVEYVDIIPPDPTRIFRPIFGRAFCSDGRIVAATMETVLNPIDPVEIATTIVHEAAHQEDRCRDREEPAIEAELAFKRDLCASVRLNRQGCQGAIGYCEP